MEFKIENQGKNIKVILMQNQEKMAQATCYFEDTPKLDGNQVGCIGELEAKDINSGVKILNQCEEVLKEKNVTVIVAPMNGNTWNKYRTLKWSNGNPPFLLENVNGIEYNEMLFQAGFKELYTYTSTKGLIENAYHSRAIEKASQKLKEHKIIIRKFDKNNYLEDFRKIYNISSLSFYRNPFYTPIDETEFLQQYEPYLNLLDEDFILLAEQNGKEIGFIFAIPNLNEVKEGKELQTLIVKTVAVIPEKEHLAIGHVLLEEIRKNAIRRSFKEWIFAFMYSNNTSQKGAKRNGTEVMREYVLYGKELVLK